MQKFSWEEIKEHTSKEDREKIREVINGFNKQTVLSNYQALCRIAGSLITPDMQLMYLMLDWRIDYNRKAPKNILGED